MYEKEIGLLSQSTSRVQWNDVVSVFGFHDFSEWNSEVDIKNRALKLKACFREAIVAESGEDELAIKVWIESNRGHYHVQHVLY